MNITLMVVGYLLAAGGFAWLAARHGKGWVDDGAQAAFLGLLWPGALLLAPLVAVVVLLNRIAGHGFKQR